MNVPTVLHIRTSECMRRIAEYLNMRATYGTKDRPETFGISEHTFNSTHHEVESSSKRRKCHFEVTKKSRFSYGDGSSKDDDEYK